MILDILSIIGAVYIIFTITEFLKSFAQRQQAASSISFDTGSSTAATKQQNRQRRKQQHRLRSYNNESQPRRRNSESASDTSAEWPASSTRRVSFQKFRQKRRKSLDHSLFATELERSLNNRVSEAPPQLSAVSETSLVILEAAQKDSNSLVSCDCGSNFSAMPSAAQVEAGPLGFNNNVIWKTRRLQLPSTLAIDCERSRSLSLSKSEKRRSSLNSGSGHESNEKATAVATTTTVSGEISSDKLGHFPAAKPQTNGLCTPAKDKVDVALSQTSSVSSPTKVSLENSTVPVKRTEASHYSALAGAALTNGCCHSFETDPSSLLKSTSSALTTESPLCSLNSNNNSNNHITTTVSTAASKGKVDELLQPTNAACNGGIKLNTANLLSSSSKSRTEWKAFVPVDVKIAHTPSTINEENNYNSEADSSEPIYVSASMVQRHINEANHGLLSLATSATHHDAKAFKDPVPVSAPPLSALSSSWSQNCSSLSDGGSTSSSGVIQDLNNGFSTHNGDSNLTRWRMKKQESLQDIALHGYRKLDTSNCSLSALPKDNSLLLKISPKPFTLKSPTTSLLPVSPPQSTESTVKPNGLAKEEPLPVSQLESPVPLNSKSLDLDENIPELKSSAEGNCDSLKNAAKSTVSTAEKPAPVFLLNVKERCNADIFVVNGVGTPKEQHHHSETDKHFCLNRKNSLPSIALSASTKAVQPDEALPGQRAIAHLDDFAVTSLNQRLVTVYDTTSNKRSKEATSVPGNNARQQHQKQIDICYAASSSAEDSAGNNAAVASCNGDTRPSRSLSSELTEDSTATDCKEQLTMFALVTTATTRQHSSAQHCVPSHIHVPYRKYSSPLYACPSSVVAVNNLSESEDVDSICLPIGERIHRMELLTLSAQNEKNRTLCAQRANNSATTATSTTHVPTTPKLWGLVPGKLDTWKSGQSSVENNNCSNGFSNSRDRSIVDRNKSDVRESSSSESSMGVVNQARSSSTQHPTSIQATVPSNYTNGSSHHDEPETVSTEDTNSCDDRLLRANVSTKAKLFEALAHAAQQQSPRRFEMRQKLKRGDGPQRSKSVERLWIADRLPYEKPLFMQQSIDTSVLDDVLNETLQSHSQIASIPPKEASKSEMFLQSKQPVYMPPEQSDGLIAKSAVTVDQEKGSPLLASESTVLPDGKGSYLRDCFNLLAAKRYATRHQTQPVSQEELQNATNFTTVREPSNFQNLVSLPSFQSSLTATADSTAQFRVGARSLSPQKLELLTGFKPIHPEKGDQQDTATFPIIKVQPQPRGSIYENDEFGNSNSSSSMFEPKLSPNLSQSYDVDADEDVMSLSAKHPEKERELSTVERRRAARNKRRQLSESHVQQSVEQPSSRGAAEIIASAEQQNGDVHKPAIGLEPVTAFKRYSRSRTQPISGADIKEAMDLNESLSLQHRLEALKQNEQQWRKRLDESKCNGSDAVILRAHSSVDGSSRPKSIADRVSCLQESQATWQKRVEEKDATALTVLSKLEKSGIAASSNTVKLQFPSVPKGKAPTFREFKSKSECFDDNSISVSEVSLWTPFDSSTLSTVCDNVMNGDQSDSGSHLNRCDIDQGLSSFYSSAINSKPVAAAPCGLDEESFNELASMSSEKLCFAKGVARPHRQRKSYNSNPLKSLNDKTHDGTTHSLSNDSGIQNCDAGSRRLSSGSTHGAQLSFSGLSQPMKPQPAIGRQLAPEAVLALASKEDFAAVSLRKTENSKLLNAPTAHVMLLHFKGRRHVQCRLVKPVVAFLNNGDCFVLVTSTFLFLYLGEFATLLEKSKAKAVAAAILKTRDLGCTNAHSIVTIDVDYNQTLTTPPSHHVEFWKTLGGQPNDVKSCTTVLEDEQYESLITSTNMIYKFENNKLVPFADYWGASLSHHMLTSNDCFVFDFGSELYVWLGKSVAPNARKIACDLAMDVWLSPYDYAECGINPVSDLNDDCATKRPSWCVFLVQKEKMECVLFKEKFHDWPAPLRDPLRISSSIRSSVSCQNLTTMTMKPCNAQAMLDLERLESNLVLEGLNLNRGVFASVDDEFKKLRKEVLTVDVTVWQINDAGQATDVREENFGLFYSHNVYIIRWRYSIRSTGMRLNGTPSHTFTSGRSRTAYFLWHGLDSSVTAQAAAALKCIEFDKEERAPHVRIVSGKEMPVFIRLFRGKMVVCKGENYRASAEPFKLFGIHGHSTEEAYIHELKFTALNLRQQSSFILLNTATSVVHCWHGKYSPHHIRELMLLFAESLCHRVHSVVKKHEEGFETIEFLKAFHAKACNDLSFPQLRTKVPLCKTMRLFELNSTSGELQAIDVPYCCHLKNLYSPLPYLQSDLYDATEPALFLLDVGNAFWLWIGGLSSTSLSAIELTSSTQWLKHVLKCAVSTVRDYQTLQSRHAENNLPVWLAWAGSEPDAFKALFPSWELNDMLPPVAWKESNIDELITLEDLERRMQRTVFYSVDQLRSRPLPADVDASKLENYLTDNDFHELFKISRQEFEAFPAWKQVKMKQESQLF